MNRDGPFKAGMSWKAFEEEKGKKTKLSFSSWSFTQNMLYFAK